MIGAIAGDIIGSTIEKTELEILLKHKEDKVMYVRNMRARLGYLRSSYDLFPTNSMFTDDTVLNAAVAYAVLNKKSYALSLRDFAIKYHDIVKEFGPGFQAWIKQNEKATSDNDIVEGNRYSNGAAVRVSPIGFAFDSLEKVQEEAYKSAKCSHNHPEGIRGAQAVASAIFLARKNADKEEIKAYIEDTYGYNLERTLNEIRPKYFFMMECHNTIPEAIIAFLESNSYEDAVRKAISLGGDSDTIACISGSIAQAYYKEIPEHITSKVKGMLNDELLGIVESFGTRFL